ncbi:MAG: PAS domain-containing protein [Acidobacteriota bacterium]
MADLDYRALFEAAPSLFLVLNPAFEIVAVNHAYLKATMTERSQILGKQIFDAFPDNPEDPAADGVRNLRASLERVVLTKRFDAMPVQKYDIQRPAALGGGFEVRYWSPVNSPVLGENGEVISIIHRVEDVTEFARLQAALRSEAENTAAERTRAEHMATEVMARSRQLGEANRQLKVANQGLADLYKEAAALVATADAELKLGGTLPLAGGEAPELDPEEILKQIKRLITGHRQLEAELRQAQKMEAVGQLAGGIAHDFNNILTVILGYCNLLLARVSAQDPIYRKLTDIRWAGEKAAELTRQLLIFSRRQVVEPKVVNLPRPSMRWIACSAA